MNFLSMWQFWIGLAIGIFIGCMVGYYLAAFFCVHGRERRLEMIQEQSLMKEEDNK